MATASLVAAITSNRAATAPVRAPLAFAPIVAREDEPVARPLAPTRSRLSHQPAPTRRRAGLQIGAPDRLHEQKVARQRQCLVGDERCAAQGVSGHVTATSVARPNAMVSPSVSGWWANRAFGAVVRPNVRRPGGRVRDLPAGGGGTGTLK